MYPLTGNVAAHVGGVQASLLAAQRLLYRLHRAGLAWGTSGSGALCGRYPMPIMKKSQYRWQMTQPVPASIRSPAATRPGAPRCLWETLRELPVSGENFGYLLWRKRNMPALNLLKNNGRRNGWADDPFPANLSHSRSCLLVCGACACPARADETAGSASPESRTRDLVGRGACARPAATAGIARRVDRATSSSAPWAAPVRAARQTVPGSVRGDSHRPFRPNVMRGNARGRRGPDASGTAEVLVFTSLSVPAASWRQWAREAARTGAPLVLRGVGEGGLPGTAKRIGAGASAARRPGSPSTRACSACSA